MPDEASFSQRSASARVSSFFIANLLGAAGARTALKGLPG